MKQKKRTFSIRGIKHDYSYTLEQITDLFEIDIATVRRWIRVDGLIRIPGASPYLVHSSDLIAFHDQRKKSRKRPCQLHEAYCLKCRLPKIPQFGSGTVTALPNGTTRFKAACSCCKGKIFKAIGRLKWSINHPLAAYLIEAPGQHKGTRPQPL
jgi:hypothetical protein